MPCQLGFALVTVPSEGVPDVVLADGIGDLHLYPTGVDSSYGDVTSRIFEWRGRALCADGWVLPKVLIGSG